MAIKKKPKYTTKEIAKLEKFLSEIPIKEKSAREHQMLDAIRAANVIKEERAQSDKRMKADNARLDAIMQANRDSGFFGGICVTPPRNCTFNPDGSVAEDYEATRAEGRKAYEALTAKREEDK